MQHSIEGEKRNHGFAHPTHVTVVPTQCIHFMMLGSSLAAILRLRSLAISDVLED